MKKKAVYACFVFDAALISGLIDPSFALMMLNELSPERTRNGKLSSSNPGIVSIKYLSMFLKS